MQKKGRLLERREAEREVEVERGRGNLFWGSGHVGEMQEAKEGTDFEARCKEKKKKVKLEDVVVAARSNTVSHLAVILFF